MALNKNDKEDIKQTAKETSIIVEDALRSISSQVGDIFRDALNNTSTFSKSLTRDIQGGINSLAKSTDIIEKNLTKLTKGELTRAEVNKQIEARKIKLQSIEKQLEIASRNNLGNTQHLNEELTKTQSYEAELLKALEAQAVEADKIDAAMGSLGASAEGLSKGLRKAGLGALDTQLGLGKALASTRKMVAENEGNVSNLEASRHLTKEVAKNITKSVDPTALIALAFKELVDALGKTDKLAGATAKAFNMSYRDALALNTQLTQTANLTGDAAVNTKGLNESVIAVGKSLGSNAVLNEKDLITFTKLREQAGYTNDELIGIQKISLVNGKTLENNTSEILGAAEAYAAQNKLVVNEKDVLREVSKASASLKLSLKGGVSALAESVVKSKQFGLNLEQADKIASGLLNFEQSISNELEAELLTGKNLNFEQARYLALQGDSVGAAAEIARQVGTSADFANMNRIQQEAIANAAGLTRDDLAQSLIDREALVALSGVEGKDAKERFDNLVKSTSLEEAKKRLGNDQLALQFQQQSVAERFNNTIEKLRELFVSLAEPILQIVSPFMNLVTNILPLINVILTPVTYTLGKIGEGLGVMVGFLTEAKDVAYVLAGTFATVLAYQNRINISKAAGIVLSKAQTLFAKKEATVSLGGAVMDAIKSVVSVPLVGPLLAAAAAAGVYALGKKYLVDDAMSPGYGKRVLSAPEGTYAFNDKDTIVAGTNLEGNNQSPLDKNIKSAPTSQINLTPLIDRMMAVEKVLTNILNKEGVIYIDSTKLGTAVSMGTYKTT